MVAYKLKRYLGLLTIPCSEVVRLASDSLDRKLPPRQQALFRFHLLICLCCFRYWKQLHFIRTILRAPSLCEPDHVSSSVPSLSQEARDRIEQALTSRLD